MHAQLPLFEDFNDKPNEAPTALDVAGLVYRPNVVSIDEQERLLAEIDVLPWQNDLKRRVQHFGYKYDYKARRIDQSMYVGALPPFAVELGRHLIAQGLIRDLPDQLIVNEYLPGQGISLHVDCEPCFKDTIVTVSLGSAYVMDFQEIASNTSKELLLEVGSALVMSGDARFRWRHGIKMRRSDHGRRRGRRVSLTFRYVILDAQRGDAVR